MSDRDLPHTPAFFAEDVTALLAAKSSLSDKRRRWLGTTMGEPVPDGVAACTLTNADGSAVAFRDLFGAQRDLLVVHNMGRSCPYCTMWADGFIGLARHLERRAAFVLTSPDPAPDLKAFAAERGWPFRCVSIHGTTFARDLGFEPTPGNFHPGVSGFHLQENGSIHRTGASRFGPGDDFCAAWPMFDLLRGAEASFVPK